MKIFVVFINLPISDFPPGQVVVIDVHNNKRKIFESIVDVAVTVSLAIYNDFDSGIVEFK